MRRRNGAEATTNNCQILRQLASAIDLVILYTWYMGVSRIEDRMLQELIQNHCEIYTSVKHRLIRTVCYMIDLIQS